MSIGSVQKTTIGHGCMAFERLICQHSTGCLQAMHGAPRVIHKTNAVASLLLCKPARYARVFDLRCHR
jgi:hypothetical protein